MFVKVAEKTASYSADSSVKHRSMDAEFGVYCVRVVVHI